MFIKINDPVSSISHLVGAIASIPITIVLIVLSSMLGNPWYIVSFSIFGASLFALYTASTVYHLIPKKENFKNIKYTARKVDHMMIYILIAGTYTPICLIALNGVWGYVIISIIWTCAIAGVIFKALVLNDNKFLRHISTYLYLLMGWLIIIAGYPLTQNMDTTSLVLLALGGIMYSIGAIIYALKKPNIPVDWLNFHDIFHFFVLLGSTCHIILMFTLF